MEPRPGGDAVPVGLVDRERDEGPDGRGVRDEGRAVVHADRRRRRCPRPRCAGCRRAVRRPVRRAPTSPAARSCCGSCCRRRRRRTSPRRSWPRRSSTGTVPADGFGSTALVSQTDMLAAAGEDIFNMAFVDVYGTNQDSSSIWNSFLSGDMSVEELTRALQDITDRVREDDSIDQDHGGVTALVPIDRRRAPGPGRRPRRAARTPSGRPRRPPRAEADVRLRQLHVRVPRRPGGRVPGVRDVAVQPGGLLLADRLDRIQADFNFIGFDNFTTLWDDEIFRRRCGTTSSGHRRAVRDDRDRPDVRLADHDRRLAAVVSCAASATRASTASCRSSRTSSRRSSSG